MTLRWLRRLFPPIVYFQKRPPTTARPDPPPPQFNAGQLSRDELERLRELWMKHFGVEVEGVDV